MLIEFSVANFMSIKEKQTFSLVASKNQELRDSNTFESGIPGVRLLPAAAIYGPNASGKTNLIFAFFIMQNIVRQSFLKGHNGDDIPVHPFRLDPQSLTTPTEFEAVFIAGGIRYQYGFSATTKHIVDEWLFAFPQKRAQHWISRTRKKDGYQWEFSASLKGQKKLWQKSTRDNALFLSTAVQFNSKQLKPIYDWFDALFISNLQIMSSDFSASQCATGEKERILAFLQQADLGIDNMRVRKLPADTNKSSEKTYYEIKTVHKNSDGKEIEFDMKHDESAGTRKIFALAGPFLESLKNGCVLFIDELDGSLHPELMRFLMWLFNNRKTNPGRAQLIFTGHETSMLDQKILRRDQIWFCEKNDEQATLLYPLTDFSPRKGTANLELEYLSGRYGALPYIAQPA